MTFTSLRLNQQSAVCALYKVKDDLSENLHEYPSSNWLTTSNKAKGQVMLLIIIKHRYSLSFKLSARVSTFCNGEQVFPIYKTQIKLSKETIVQLATRADDFLLNHSENVLKIPEIQN